MLKEENVNIAGLVTGEKSSTSASVVLSDSGGERTFLHCLGANAEFTDTDVSYIDLFIPSYEEAVQLSGKGNPEEIADVFLSMGVKVAVIKLGRDGCFIKAQSGEKYLIPTYTDIKPVDTTGAGDSFVAGFLTGLTKG